MIQTLGVAIDWLPRDPGDWGIRHGASQRQMAQACRVESGRMVNERPGKYHKDRFKPKPWHETPLTGPEAERALTQFRFSFGSRRWESDPLVYLTWQERRWFKNSVPVFECDVVTREPWLWAFRSRCVDVYRGSLTEIQESARHFKLEAWYLTPSLFDWCICGGWDFQYLICDPHGRFEAFERATYPEGDEGENGD